MSEDNSLALIKKEPVKEIAIDEVAAPGQLFQSELDAQRRSQADQHIKKIVVAMKALGLSDWMQ